MANMKTTAFRADAVKFDTAMSSAAAQSVAFATTGENFISRKAGSLTQTGNTLDVAVAGNSWMAFRGPSGTVYTRDGRMQLDATGQLQNVAGYPVLDAGGTPIVIDPNAGPLNISRNGAISQGNNQVGVLGLYDIPAAAKLERFANSGVIPDRAATAVIDFVNTGFEQGFVESSNVDAMSELTQLMNATRSFEGASTAIETSESTLQNAIRTLGDPGKA